MSENSEPVFGMRTTKSVLLDICQGSFTEQKINFIYDVIIISYLVSVTSPAIMGFYRVPVLLGLVLTFTLQLSTAFTATSKVALVSPHGLTSWKFVPLHATVPKEDEITTTISDVVVEKGAAKKPVSGKITKDAAVPYDQLTIGVLKETFPGEMRVSQSPDSIATLVKAGFNVVVQAGGE